MDEISLLPALPQDEVRVGASAEVRELMELQLAPLGRRGLDGAGAAADHRFGQVKAGKAHCEDMFSALPSTADITGRETQSEELRLSAFLFVAAA